MSANELMNIWQPFLMTAIALILNKVFSVTQGQHMTHFADIKSKTANWWTFCVHFAHYFGVLA